MAKYKFQQLLEDIVASTTGGCAGVAGYTKLGLQFVGRVITSGNGVFKVQGTVDGTEWTYLAFIDNLVNSNSQTLTRVASKTISANGNALVWLDDARALRAIRVSITRTTDGSYSASMIAVE